MAAVRAADERIVSGEYSGVQTAPVNGFPSVVENRNLRQRTAKDTAASGMSHRLERIFTRNGLRGPTAPGVLSTYPRVGPSVQCDDEYA
ncbi:MAG: hypothetical protein AAFP69_13140 [Planctomycetota bacterium]